MRIQDLRRDQRIMQNNPVPTRRVSQINRIARHHSATTAGDVFAFQNHWRTGGYHEIILRDGSVQLVYDETVITNGVGNHNTGTYHICLVGNSNFTAVQETAFLERARRAMERFGLQASDVLGHNEFSGHRANICPGIDMQQVRSRLRMGQTSKVTHTVRAGETLSGIARLHGTTVQALQRLNHIANPNVIRTGQRLQLPSGQKQGRVHARSGLHLRTGPGTNHRSLRVLGNGTVVSILETRHDWHRVNVGNQTGWVSAQFITI